MSTDSMRQIGYAFELVMTLAVGINLGVKVGEDAFTCSKKRVCVALQNDLMNSWVHVTCCPDDTYIHSFNGEGHKLWLQGLSISLTEAEAEKLHGILGCRRLDDSDDEVSA